MPIKARNHTLSYLNSTCKILFRIFVSPGRSLLCQRADQFSRRELKQHWASMRVQVSRRADLSGNNHNGTLVNGPVWTTGKYGQAIAFDGTNDYVNIPDRSDYTLNPAQSYAWSAWVKNTNFNPMGNRLEPDGG